MFALPSPPHFRTTTLASLKGSNGIKHLTGSSLLLFDDHLCGTTHSRVGHQVVSRLGGAVSTPVDNLSLRGVLPTTLPSQICPSSPQLLTSRSLGFRKLTSDLNDITAVATCRHQSAMLLPTSIYQLERRLHLKMRLRKKW